MSHFALQCETCGSGSEVREIVVHWQDEARPVALCPTCKAALVERRRVARKQGRRLPTSLPARVGLALVAFGLVVLVLLGAVAISRAVTPDKEPECYPGAGFTCKR